MTSSASFETRGHGSITISCRPAPIANHIGATEYYGELKVARGDVAGARLMLARLDKICAFGCADAEELRRWIDAGGDPQAN